LLEIPQAGALKIGGEDISFNGYTKPKKKDIRRICQQTGMVFQNFQLFPHLTVLDNIMRGLVVVQKWPVAKAKARAEELLTKVGMLHKRDAWPAMLSGGQQQRVAIARALARRPKSCSAMNPPRRSTLNCPWRWWPCYASSPRRAPPC
jgi:cystine transport system ATP-binding protein